ncbi:MAG: FBP domain-containing protein [Myxococcaceae bacterium]|nr:FBP domain-containing protein [Myxococcaceae bacterium]
MFRIASEKELFDAFRPRDRAVVEVPKGFTFPLVVRDYLGWRDASGSRVFLLFTAPGEKVPTGVAFRRDHASTGEPAHLCEWCHTIGTSDVVGLLTTDVNSKKRVGISLCLDLGCGARLEDAADRAGRNGRAAVRALLGRMAKFTRGALGVTEANRG